jgi:hypothetical protein
VPDALPDLRLVQLANARISEMATKHRVTYPLAMKCLTTPPTRASRRRPLADPAPSPPLSQRILDLARLHHNEPDSALDDWRSGHTGEGPVLAASGALQSSRRRSRVGSGRHLAWSGRRAPGPGVPFSIASHILVKPGKDLPTVAALLTLIPGTAKPSTAAAITMR